MNSNSLSPNALGNGRCGVVAVIVRDGCFLVIRRSRYVVAPGWYCFPGGGIEAGESEEEALVREIREELGAEICPVRRIWRSTTPWGVNLSWWLSEIGPSVSLSPNPQEVESCHWRTPDQMFGLSQLLESNLEFLDALASGEIDLAVKDFDPQDG